jgi:hypothetical protein
LWRVSFRSEAQTVLRDNWNGGKKGICPLSPPSLLPIPSDETINFLAAIPALYKVYKNLHNRVNGPVGKNFHMEDSKRWQYTVKRRQI